MSMMAAITMRPRDRIDAVRMVAILSCGGDGTGGAIVVNGNIPVIRRRVNRWGIRSASLGRRYGEAARVPRSLERRVNEDYGRHVVGPAGHVSAIRRRGVRHGR